MKVEAVGHVDVQRSPVKITQESMQAHAPPSQTQPLREEAGGPVGQRQITREQIERAVMDLNKGTQVANKLLRFVYNEDVDQMVVRVVDTQTQEVIKELPPERVIEAAIRIREFIGMLLDERV